MAGRIRLRFRGRMLLLILAVCWSLFVVFMIFQYHREKEFKTEILDNSLQTNNAFVLDRLRRGDSVLTSPVAAITELNPVRVTVIDSSGKVVLDNNDRTPFPTANHNSRPEIAEARIKGVAHITERHSESDDDLYFYSARLGDNGTVVRSAAPYSHSLREFLKADESLIWIMAGITVLMSVIIYFISGKIALTITRLNSFAEKAEKGEPLSSEEAFPDDELGSIAGHIVRLYVQRDRQHREALAAEQDKIRIKKQLTNNINHELKTPAAAIILCLDILKDHPEIPEAKRNEIMERIRTNAQRLGSLLKDIGEITRMDEAPDIIEKSDVELSSLIGEIATEMMDRTDIAINIAVHEFHVNGNRGLLESMFRNLFENAIAYSGATEISVVTEGCDTIVFQDNGCGIPEQHLPHIFERFYRVDKGRSRNLGGTGLGLAIVRNAVRIHGGEISARNDRGLLFRIKLPATI